MQVKLSIISVNYNGKHLLKNFLESVQNLNFPKKEYEMIVVDNGSKDGSVEFLKEYFPWVRIIKSNKNLGFGGGNNLGIKQALGEYLLLVNNDTLLEKDSVKNLVDCFERWSKEKKIGAVSAKLVFYDKYLNFKVKEAYFHDYSLPYSLLPVTPKLYILKSYSEDLCWEDVSLPIAHKIDSGIDMSVFLKKRSDQHYSLQIGKKILSQGVISTKNEIREVQVRLSKQNMRRYAFDLIQNAGTYLFRDGCGRDRGTMIVGGSEYYETDLGQYDKEELIDAFCGAGVLISRKAIADVGAFDPLFFMYYEDDDLSLRFKKKGWEIVYCPKAVIRHIHAASSIEWSKSFIFNVEKNRMLFVSKHWPRSVVLREWFKYIIKDTFGVPIYHYYYREYREAAAKLELRLRVNLSLICLVPYYLLRSKRLKPKDLLKFQ